METSFMTREELLAVGFASVGRDVLISRKASIYGAERIRIGNNVRIDDFCVLSGRITLENYIHIAVSAGLFGGEAGITMEEFTTLGSGSFIYAVSTDFEYGIPPVVPEKYVRTIYAPVRVRRHTIIATGCRVLHGVTLAEGTAVGAMSLVLKSTEPWSVYVGIPARKLRDRGRRALEMEELFRKEWTGG